LVEPLLQYNQYINIMAPDNDNEQQDKPHGYRVEDDSNLEEKDLRRKAFMFGSGRENRQRARYGRQPLPVVNVLAKSSNTPAGDDKNNPSQNAGNTNEYFSRTEPSDEHPEYNNFKDPSQLGQSNYTETTGAVPNGQSDERKRRPC
jgi:hypothetical protein